METYSFEICPNCGFKVTAEGACTKHCGSIRSSCNANVVCPNCKANFTTAPRSEVLTFFRSLSRRFNFKERSKDGTHALQ